jgi:hypothetical protein
LLAGAVATAKLHDHVKRESEQRALLAEAGRIISSSPAIDKVFDLFANKVRKLLHFDRIAITEYEVESGMAVNLFSKGA